MRPLKVAVPNKGRLSDDAIAVLARAGIKLRGSSERTLFATALDGRIQVMFLRAHDIPHMIADGNVDAGITGLDAVEESGHALDARVDLGFGHCRLVAAVPVEHAAQTAAEIPVGSRIATSYPNLTRRFFQAQGIDVKVTTVSGACEVTPALGVADAITDLTSTGSTLAMNHLRELETILDSTCHLVTAPEPDAEVVDELERLVFALQSVVAAQGKRYLMADLPRVALKEVRQFLPGLAGPTVVDIEGDADMVAIQVVVDESEIFDAVHRLQQIGGRGILVLPIERLVP